MTLERIIELLKIERECVVRNSNGICDRNCAFCDLVQTDSDLLEMYDATISFMERVNYELDVNLNRAFLGKLDFIDK